MENWKWPAESQLAAQSCQVDQIRLRQSYGATVFALRCAASENWARQDSNLGPRDYESPALTAELQARVFMEVKHSQPLMTNPESIRGCSNSELLRSRPQSYRPACVPGLKHILLLTTNSESGQMSGAHAAKIPVFDAISGIVLR